jgi:hypothetical protein
MVSRITWQTEERVTSDPWAQRATTVTARVGWTCVCGATSGRRLRYPRNLTTSAGAHLISEHNAPAGNQPDGCVCGYVAAESVRDHVSELRGHSVHHETWVAEVWDV